MTPLGIAEVVLDFIKFTPEFFNLQLVLDEFGFMAPCLPVADYQREDGQGKEGKQGPACCCKESQSNRKCRTQVDKSVDAVDYSAQQRLKGFQEASNNRDFSQRRIAEPLPGAAVPAGISKMGQNVDTRPDVGSTKDDGGSESRHMGPARPPKTGQNTGGNGQKPSQGPKPVDAYAAQYIHHDCPPLNSSDAGYPAGSLSAVPRGFTGAPGFTGARG